MFILLIFILTYFVILISTYIFQRNLLYHPKENNYFGDKLIVFVEEVKIKINSGNELVRAMAIWALFSLDRNEFNKLKQKKLKFETSPYVRKEWMQGDKLIDSM